jgi:NRAMP (natural resistance-associated macrophage protein)-like metal ion transporter
MDPTATTTALAPPRSSLSRRLGPGLITGAADDDPSGIATYSQVGAQFGYALAWTMLFSLPFMIVIQEISARIGVVTGRGIADNLRRRYPPALVRGVVILLLIANVINLGADLGAMGAALRQLLGGRVLLHTAAFGLFSVLAEMFLSYRVYSGVLKWLTLSLFTYVAVVFVAHVAWRDALLATLLPRLTLDADHATGLVAVLGTTISPYLFFWQAALEVEDARRRGAPPLSLTPDLAPAQFRRIRTDTTIGMGASNLVALFIILATGATLHASGITTIETTAQAAEALRPIAGEFAYVVFAAGVIGTGLLAVPVLAGSSAYALSEAFGWREGLDLRPAQATWFYATIAAATLAGVALNATPLNPVRALYWSAVVNGVLAAPVMAVMMLIGGSERVMGALTLPRPMLLAGWAATALMLLASIGLLVL